MEAVVWIWLAAALIFVAIEIFSPGFIFACFVVGSLGAAVCGYFAPESYLLQAGIFGVVSIILIPLTRPLAAKITKPSPSQSNVDGLVGKIAYVKKIVTETEGQVMIDGEIWQARAESEIDVDAKVKVLAVEGTKVKVEKI